MEIKTVSDLLRQNAPQLTALLPKVITPERFMSLCINVVQNDEKLHDCTSTSLVRCMFQAAQMGLTPGLRRQVYLIPYKNKKKQCTEAQLQIGYQGLLTMARRSGQISKIDAGYVMDGDIFEFANGFDVTLRHVENSEHRREGWKDAWIGEGEHRRVAQDKAWEHVTYVYAFAKLTNGERHLKVMTKEEIEWHRERYSKAAHDGPWVENPIEMGEKTTLRELCNLLPSDEEDALLGKAVTLDRQLEDGQPQTIEVTGFVIPEDADEKSSRAAGSNGSAHKPSEPAKPQALSLPNFGQKKGKPVDDPSVTVDDLVFYLGVKEKDLGKAGRESYHDSDVKMIAAIKAEMERRKGLAAAAGTTAQTQAQPAETKKEPPTEPAKPAEPKPAETGEMSDVEWQAFVDRVTLGADVPFWTATKKEFKIKVAGALPLADRRRFVARFEALKNAAVPA